MGVRQRDLLDGEEIVVEFRPASKRVLAPFVAGVLVLAMGIWLVMRGRVGTATIRDAIVAGAITIVGLWLVARWRRWHRRTIVVTSDRVLLVEAGLRRRLDQVRRSRIVEVHLDQTLWMRLARRGTILLELDDGTTVAVEDVPHPTSLHRLLSRTPSVGAAVDGGLPLPLLVGDSDPTPPRGVPAVSAPDATSRRIRRDEIDRLEAGGLLGAEEAARRRSELDEPS